MIVILPLRTGHTVPPPVVRGIADQSLACMLLPVTVEGMEDSRVNEAEARFRGFELAFQITHGNPGVVLFVLDRDVCLYDPLCIEGMLKVMLHSPDIGSLHFPYKDMPPAHTYLGAVMVRREVAVQYRRDDFQECDPCCCAALTRAVERAGMRQEWYTKPAGVIR